MTRINVGVPPRDLTGKHLIAEHREIKRIPNAVAKGRYNLKSVPQQFTLGKGHVAFFYPRLGYLKKRYESLYQECKARGYNVQNYINAWDNIPKELIRDYTPTPQDIQIITQRIADRIASPIAKQKKIKVSE